MSQAAAGETREPAARSSRPTRAVRRKHSPTRSSSSSTAEVQVEIVHRGVGAITESDILLAKASGAIIIGFHVRPDNNARAAAEREGVDIKLYRIIYEAVADVRAALEGMLRPEEREVVLGEAEVREMFKVSRIGTIAGCSVRSGIINRAGPRARHPRRRRDLRRHASRSLRRFKDDVKEVTRRLRVRYRHRELQRPQGRRRHRVLPHRGSRAHARSRRRRADRRRAPTGRSASSTGASRGARSHRTLTWRLTTVAPTASPKRSARRSRASSPTT